MRDLSSFTKVFICKKPIDFRKQINGCLQLVDSVFSERKDNAKYLFVFRNKNRTCIKMLYWDSTGYALWTKKLEEAKFPWPKIGEDAQVVKVSELRWLLAGVDYTKMQVHQAVSLTGT